MNRFLPLFRLLGLCPTALSQFSLSAINNTLGTFFFEEGSLKITNEKWTLLVYKDLAPIKETIAHNNKILEGLLDSFINVENPRMLSFRSNIQTHVSLLNQIADSVSQKYREIMADTQSYKFRTKRGIINGIGTIWKTITGNLDASDGEYFNDCIDKITQDERHLESLLKNQISVTTSVIRNFNTTLQKLRIDEETFNRDVSEIQKSIIDISDDLSFYDAQVRTLDICESLMESYTFLEINLNDILNSISFARLKILHSSIITPRDLIDSLQQISQSLRKNNLPLPIYSASVAQYIDIIELEAYQSDSKIVFVLKIPLVEPETYTLFHLYPIPISDNRTGLHHMIVATQRFVARDDNSISYVSLPNLEGCKLIKRGQRICSDVLPYPIDSEAICEAQLLRNPSNLPKTCHVTVLLTQGYSVRQIDANLWLITVSDQIPVTVKCEGREMKTQIVNSNSLLKLQPLCNAFIGSTRVHAKPLVEKYQNVTYNSHPVTIPYDCCQHIREKPHIPDLKPLKLNKIDVEDLNLAQHKLDRYSEELDELLNKPFISRHLHWFTVLTITLIVILTALYIFCKCRRKKQPSITFGPANPGSDDRPSPPRPQLRKSHRFKLNSILPKRRPSIRPEDNPEEFEIF